MGVIAADPSGGGLTITAWMAAWPLTAAALGALPVLLAASGGPQAATIGISVVALATVAVRGTLARDRVEP